MSLMLLMREELQRSHVLIATFGTIIFQTVHAIDMIEDNSIYNRNFKHCILARAYLTYIG